MGSAASTTCQSLSGDIKHRNWERAQNFTEFYHGFEHGEAKALRINGEGWLGMIRPNDNHDATWNACLFLGFINIQNVLPLRMDVKTKTDLPAATNPRNFTLQPMEKLKKSPPAAPIEIEVFYPGLSTDRSDHMASMMCPVIKVEGKYVDRHSFVRQLIAEQTERMIQAATEFTGKTPESSEEAEALIDDEIERRINETRLEEVVPMSSHFNRLPGELRIRIWSYAIFSKEGVKPSLHREGAAELGRRPSAIGLLLANKSLYNEIVEVLYNYATFWFYEYHDFDWWSSHVRLQDICRIRELILVFPYIQAVKFFGHAPLGSTPLGQRMFGALGTSTNCRIAYPEWKMDPPHMKRCCYLTMCRYITKAAMTCFIEANGSANIHFEPSQELEDEDETTESELEVLEMVWQYHRNLSYRELGLDLEEGDDSATDVHTLLKIVLPSIYDQEYKAGDEYDCKCLSHDMELFKAIKPWDYKTTGSDKTG